MYVLLALSQSLQVPEPQQQGVSEIACVFIDLANVIVTHIPTKLSFVCDLNYVGIV